MLDTKGISTTKFHDETVSGYGKYVMNKKDKGRRQGVQVLNLRRELAVPNILDRQKIAHYADL